MQPRPEPVLASSEALSVTSVEHVLGPVELASPSIPPLTRHRRPLPALTGLRFCAASYVVLFHTRLTTLLRDHGYPHASRFFANGYLAVPLFFLLSGFILAYTYRAQLATRGSSARFWEARFARLWPAYAFSLLCSSLTTLSVPKLSLALATLCMVQAWNPWHSSYAGAWNFVCWTLSVEAFFYLIFPGVQRLFERLRMRATSVVGCLIMVIAVACNVSAHTLGATDYPSPWNRVPFPVIHTPEFLIGVAMGNLYILLQPRLTGEVSSVRVWSAYTSLGVLTSALALCLLHGSLTSFILPCFALLIAGLAIERNLWTRLLSTRALVLGGAISYSMYLLQTPVRTLVHSGGSPSAGLRSQILIPVVLLPLSYVVYRFLEEPARAGLRRLFAALQSTRSRFIRQSPHQR